jgi:hypothetical protein
VIASGSRVVVTVQGAGGQAVVLQSARVEVQRSLPQPAGLFLRAGCGNEVEPRFFQVDLDRPEPRVGHRVEVLGTTSTGLSVWRSEDGNRWEATPLRDSEDATVALAAGPHGVLVVRSDPEHAGLRYWRSGDGRSFDALEPLPGAEDVLPNSALLVVATPDGFLVEPGYAAGSASAPLDDEPDPVRVFASPDGVEWEDIAPGLPGLAVEGLAGNGGTVVLVATSLRDEGQQVWFRRDGVWRRAGIDPGRLPDPAVGTAVGRTLDRVRDWGDGFVLLGHTVTACRSTPRTSRCSTPGRNPVPPRPPRPTALRVPPSRIGVTRGRAPRVAPPTTRASRTGPSRRWRAGPTRTSRYSPCPPRCRTTATAASPTGGWTSTAATSASFTGDRR